jgi:hypothetical protein
MLDAFKDGCSVHTETRKKRALGCADLSEFSDFGIKNPATPVHWAPPAIASEDRIERNGSVRLRHSKRMW